MYEFTDSDRRDLDSLRYLMGLMLVGRRVTLKPFLYDESLVWEVESVDEWDGIHIKRTDEDSNIIKNHVGLNAVENIL